MKKQSTKSLTEKEFLETTPTEVKFPKEDYETMRLLWRRILSGDDYNLIFTLFKKYINPTAPAPLNNCNCAISLSAYYEQLRDFWAKNTDKFEK